MPSPPTAGWGQATLELNLIQSAGSGTLIPATNPDGPIVSIDGRQQRCRWQRIVVPLSPGRHHVDVHVPYPFPKRFGPARSTIDLAPGQRVVLEYRTPMFTLAKGSLGPPPQRARGWGAMLGLFLGIVVATVVFAVFVVALR